MKSPAQFPHQEFSVTHMPKTHDPPKKNNHVDQMRYAGERKGISPPAMFADQLRWFGGLVLGRHMLRSQTGRV